METSFNVNLSPNANYKPVEVITQRLFRQQQEYLVKWSLLEDKLTNTTDALKQSRDSFCKDYFVWMRQPEMEACCPQLLAMETGRPREGSDTEMVSMQTESQSASEEEPLAEMKDDIKNLLSRAKRLSSHSTSTSGKMLSNIINVLSAYANIGPLANTFRENGALDLLLTLLASQNTIVHKSAGNMLRSLTTFDLSSRSYVLLQLSKSDSAGATSAQSRQMLLDLFSETASTGESDVLLKGITLPQVPGRYVFSLLKKYLRVNSITASTTSSQIGSMEGSGSELTEFEKFYALDHLVSDLFTFFGWFEGSVDSEAEREVGKATKGLSIFAGTVPVEQEAPKEKKNPYQTRDDYRNDREYGRYVKATIKAGMKVRARVTYESVSMGDYGIYRQTNDGTPPAQFMWEGLGDTYWVYWHQVELVPPDDEVETESSEASQTKSPPRPAAPKQTYVMRSLTGGQEGPQRSKEKVNQPFWWEVLCVLKSQAEELVGAVIETLNDKHLKKFEDLINFSPDYSQVAKVLELLETTHPHLCQETLTIRERAQFLDVYTNETDKIPAASGESDYDIADELQGNFRKEAPFPDPYHEEEIEHISASVDFEDHPFSSMLGLRRRREFPDALMQLYYLEHSQDGTVDKMKSAKETIDKILVKAPKSSHVALQGIKVMKAGCEMMRREGERQEMCVSGFHSFVLKLMQISPRSYKLQSAGVECFFKLVGGYGIDPTYMHLDKTEGSSLPVISSASRSVITTMLVSLAAVSEKGLKALVDGMKCVVDYFHTHMPRTQLKNALSTACGGLIVLTIVLCEKEVVSKFESWGVPELLKSMITDFPNFPGKRDLIIKISRAMSCSEIEGMFKNTSEHDDEVSATNKEVIAVIKSLCHGEDLKGKNPLVRLISFINDHTVFYKAKFLELPPVFVDVFMRHHGVFYLCQALEVNGGNEPFVEHVLALICSLIEFSEEVAAEVVLQGGLRAIVNILSNNSQDRHKYTVSLRALEALSKDPDHLAVMAAENIITPLNNAKLMFQNESLGETVNRLSDLCETEESSRAALNQKILRIIFSGVLQLFLAAIEDARREGESVNLPRFSAFIKYLSAGSGGAVSALQEQWWEALEVSSNSQHKEHLVDGNQATFWESTGRSGTHWIRLHMKKGLIVKKMYMEVSPEVPNYMPQKVSVHAGPTADNAQEISSVYIPATFNGSYQIVTNAKKFYAVMIIRIKKCQLGGIDCRIKGIKCQATTTSLWPLFGDIFSARSKMFYQIQLQTWLNSKSDPLELFDKLSSVILYEQMFGDNFLHTTQAKQCIGQACRSALVTPLIETLTKPNSGGPDLGALINEYIEQMHAPLASQWKTLALNMTGGRSLDQGMSDMDVLSVEYTGASTDLETAQQRLIKMSQIRRICRLMVDWEGHVPKRPSKQEPEEERVAKWYVKTPGFWMNGQRYGVDEVKEAEEKAKMEREEEERTVVLGSGTVALAKCWTIIVENHVSAALKQFNLDSPYQVAAELISLFDHLKQAMLELFGGHSQFALALKEGFSRAFQSLDEVTGVKFCELLCQCIDSVMDSCGKDSARLHSLGESQREMMLLHFAEPLQFLHQLDLAHIFEHYYKQHLSARILRGRSISLLLEKRLSQTFAHCFPLKSPLQMLNDLDSSQTLMDRFCDSELLESLDQLMVQASQQSTLPLDIMTLSQKCSLYRERLLQVYTLNPCFWPVRPRPLPVASLPPTLAQFCEDYTKFFSSAHDCGLQQHERPRRLQFTLLGWAVVAYRGVKLVLSTVHMCVLLQFISGKSHTIQSLQEATQLSYQEVSDSLLSLTSERQAILVAETTPSATPPCDDDHELQLVLLTSPFKVGTLFSVNEEFVKEVLTKHKSTKVRVHNVHLATRGQPVSSTRHDRAANLAHVFERRRTIMDSTIVRILKKEKQMSVDNIAHKVIKGCSAGRFDRGASFGRFDCDYRDVCSRVDRLIVSGYIKRDMANRQMLVYVPDPGALTSEDIPVDPTPEDLPSTKLKGATSTKVSFETGTSASSVGGVSVTSVAPKATTGATAVPKSTSAPASTASAPKSSRKRSGVGRQPQSKTKRKPTSLTRIYANEAYEQCEAPLLGMLPTSHSLGPSEVQSQINSLLQSLSPVLKLDVETLEHLLHHFKWNTDKLIEEFLTDSAAILEGAGLSGTAGTSPPARRRSVVCPVCMATVTSRDLMWLWCNHGCCKSCWQSHLLTQIDLNRALLCSCPVFDCPARPNRSFFVQTFGSDTDPMNKFSKAVVQSYVERSNWLTWCRNPQGCTQVLCRGDGMATGACQMCSWTSCFSCTFIESHQPATCEDMQKWVELGGFYVGMDEDAKSKQLANIIAKKCPSCGAQIEKNEGCLHMKCKCGFDFCWKCMKSWKSHNDYFKCSAKVSKAARDHKKFQDFNDLCTSHHRSKCFAEKLVVTVKGISASVPIKTLSFVSDACQLLVQCHKMLLYTCIAEFFSKMDMSGYLGFLSESLEGDTNVLQAFLENTLLFTTVDVAKSLKSIPEKRLQDGYNLVSKIENTRDKLLIGAQQQFKLGEITELGFHSDEEDEEEEEKERPQYRNYDAGVYTWTADDDDLYEDDMYSDYSDYEDSYHDAFDSWDDHSHSCDYDFSY